MSEYIPKYPTKEDDDSNKTSSELLAETLKPIYVPQDLMLAWESHLANYSRDTHVLLDQVKDSEAALNTQYQSLLARIQKYEQMLQDITMDSNEFTMDSDVVNFTGWNILAQASYWDYLLRKEITKLSDQIKSVEFKGGLVSEVSNTVLENLSSGNQYISNIIGALTDSPLMRDLDEALSGTSIGLSTLRREHEELKAKQYADAIALANQNGETFDQLSLTFNNLISEQIDRIADEAATRTRVFQELEDGIAAEAQLRYEGQEAIASQVLAIKTSTETAVAGILQDYSTIAGTNEAITTALNTYSAQVEGTIATILTDYVSYANLETALVSKSDELLAIVNDNIAKLNITNEITAGLSSIKAISTISVDLNGVIAGYGLISELENGVVKSAFGVNADTFYIGKPTDKVKPFVVTSVPKNIDGIDFPAGTWINTAIIANATIGSAHIKEASITNAHIKELDASKITTGTLDAKRIRIGDATHFDTGYRPTDVLNTAKSYVDNVQIGGTNLALNTGIELSQYFWGVVTTSPLIQGKEYTISFDYIGNVTGRLFLNNSVIISFPAVNAGTWTRASVTFVFVKNDYSGYEILPHVYGATNLRNLKLEVGNKGTDWTPAPEDVDAAISSASSAASTAKGTADSAYNLANTANNTANSANSSASAANSQLALWKYPNSTYIDGGKIYTNSITANQINVANLSSLSANLGTIKVGTANIDELAVTTFKIQDRAVTSSLTQTFAFSWSVSTDYAAWQYPTVSKSVNLNGFETSIVGSRCLLFVQTDLLAEARNDRSGDRVSSTGIHAEILLGTTVIATIPSLRTYGGLLTKDVNVEGGNSFYNIVGSYTNRAVISYGAFMAPFTMTAELKQPSVPLTIRIVTSATNNYGMNLYVSATNLTAYLVEFKK